MHLPKQWNELELSYPPGIKTSSKSPSGHGPKSVALVSLIGKSFNSNDDNDDNKDDAGDNSDDEDSQYFISSCSMSERLIAF